MTTFTRLVLSGGGAKATTFGGAVLGLKDTLPSIRHIAGSSAGAISAALLAVGMPPRDFRTLLLHTNLKALMGARVSGAVITKDGVPITALLREKIETCVLEAITSDFIYAGIENDKDTRFIFALKTKLETKQGGVTFGDLKKLHELDPVRFKKLTVTAVRHPDGQLKIFDCDETPNVEIALACRASASLPVFLEPVEIDGERYMDGGLYDNIPTNYFDKDNDQWCNKKPPETLVLAFGSGVNERENLLVHALEDEDSISIALVTSLIENALQKAPPSVAEFITNMGQAIAEQVANKAITSAEAALLQDAVAKLNENEDPLTMAALSQMMTTTDSVDTSSLMTELAQRIVDSVKLYNSPYARIN